VKVSRGFDEGTWVTKTEGTWVTRYKGWMPWKEVTQMEERTRFVMLARSDRYTITELCESFGISRKTGHKWLARYGESGMCGLSNRSRAPTSVPNRTEDQIERLVVAERKKHETWGGKKIRMALMRQHGIESPPSVRTVDAILKRNGLVKPRRRRGAVYKVERGALTAAERPHHVLAVDFKGWFLTGDKERFEPLTVTDLYSRYLVRAEGLPQTPVAKTQRAFRALFRTEGLPEIIRVDNGSPFASMGPGGLSRLSVWWISLGIEVQFTRPGCPQDNGSHERMHRTMKEECCRPPNSNRPAQQQRMDRWRRHFNEQRPHEGIGLQFPADLYHPSKNRMNERIKPTLYDAETVTKKVNAAGFISFEGKNCFVGEAFGGVRVAIEEHKDEVHVRFANVKLGSLPDGPKGRLRPPPYKKRWEKK
jgi:transposase InsO family protein